MRKSFFRSAFQSASLFLLVVGGIGCTASGTINTGPGNTVPGACNPAASVSCSQGSGYTCDSGVTPDAGDPALACSSGVVTSSGLVAYCCTTSNFPTGSSCSADAAVTGCQVGSYGYSCTGSTRPESVDTSLVCSDGVVNGSAVDYCCISGFTSSACSPDSTITSCQGSSYGFSCTGNASPTTADSSLVCSVGVPSPTSSAYLYCCESGTTVSSGCGADSTVTGCVGGSSGYTCTGAATPSPSLNCSSGVPGVGQTTVYCCGGTSAGSCAADSTVSCGSGSSGYSCTGTTRPDADGTLQCSSGVATSGGAGTGYCCYSAPPTTTSTCTADGTVTGCTGGSYGFACSGTDSPADANTSLVCGPGAAGNDGNTLYCCASK